MANFSHIIGNEPLKLYLERMVEKRTIANSLLFAGLDGIGKGLFAEAFARLVLCRNDPEGVHRRKLDAGVHPDLRIYRPEGKIGAHSIDTMRQFGEEVYLTPFEADRKVFILHDAERMLPSSANALLKTFEEPASWSIIILLTSSPEALLPTIVSRCHTLHFQPIAEDKIANLLQEKMELNPEAARALAVLSEGSIGNAWKLAKEGRDRLRHRILEVLAQGKLSNYTKLMQIAAEISGYIEESQKQTEELLKAELLKAYPNDPSAVQQQVIDKEVEGRSAMHLVSHSRTLFAIIMSWYRDLHLLAVGGNRAYLVNRDFEDQADQAVQRGEILPLETVQAAIAKTMLALERSTPLKGCLENLFLQLNLI